MTQLLLPSAESEAEAYVDGVSVHYQAVRRRVVHYVVVPTAMVVLFALMRWFFNLTGAGGEHSTTPDLVLVPVSGSNLIAMYAFLAAAVFAVRFSGRAGDMRTSGRSDIDASEFAERSVLVVVSMLIGWAAVGLAWLCAVWYFRLGEHFDPVRVLGPLAATALLVVLSAENQYAAEIPRDPQLRAVLDRREHERLEAGRDRLAFARWRKRDRFVQIAIVTVLPILTVAMSMIVSWPDSLVGALSRFLVAALFGLIAFGLLVRWHVVWAERRYLDAFGIAAIAGCIAVIYALTGFIVLAESASTFAEVVRPLASLYICVFGPWVALVLFCTRAFGGRGIVLALADRGMGKRLEHGAVRRIRKRAREWVPLLCWLSVLVPILPIVLSRSTMRLQRSRTALLIVGWVEIGVIVVGGLLASVLLP